MRTFLLSIAVFLLIIGILVFTGIYLVRRTSEIISAARSLPSASPEGKFPTEETRPVLQKLTSAWHSTRKTIRFLVGHEEADKIDDYLAELQIRATTRDAAGYMSAREKLLQALARLADSESFSFDSVT